MPDFPQRRGSLNSPVTWREFQQLLDILKDVLNPAGGTSTAKTTLLPTMTTAQRDALTAANGMIIYNTTTGKFQGYEAGAWTNLI